MQTWKLVLCCLVAAASSAAQARDYPVFPAAPFMQLKFVAEDMVFNGVPTRLLEFVADRPPHDIKAFYRSRWAGKIVETDLDTRYILAHRDGDYLFTVDIIDTGSSLGARGTLSLSPFFGPQAKASNDLGKGFPTPPHSTILNDIRAVDGVNRSRTLIFRSPQGVSATYDFLDRRFSQEGWRRANNAQSSSATGPAESSTFMLNRRNEELNVSLVQEAQGTLVVAVLVVRR